MTDPSGQQRGVLLPGQQAVYPPGQPGMFMAAAPQLPAQPLQHYMVPGKPYSPGRSPALLHLPSDMWCVFHSALWPPNSPLPGSLPGPNGSSPSAYMQGACLR